MNVQNFIAKANQLVFASQMNTGQAAGITAILAAWQTYGNGNPNDLADILATAKWETGNAMTPVYERGPLAYFDKYEPGTPLGRALGNTNKGDGYLFRGRGLCQITGRGNYRRIGRLLGIDLENNPDLALQPEIAARILILGSLGGWFTGKGLSAYIDAQDEADAQDFAEFVQARRVINGVDHANDIAQIALNFEHALRQAA